MATYNVAAATGVAATDTANINSALTSANGDPGSTVVLAAGTYIINNRLGIGSSTEFKGAGASTSKIQVADNALGTDINDCISPDGSPMIYCLSGVPHDISIHDFEFDGNCDVQSTILGLAHGSPSSAGSGVERIVGLYGSSGGSDVSNISVYNMHFHDCFGEALHIRYGTNIKFYDNDCENMQHDAVFCLALTGSGNEIHDNVIEAITDGGIRCDSSQNVKIYNNTITPYTGSNNNGAYKLGENGIQIANNASYTQLTNNIEIYDNTFTDIDLVGIWLNDAKNTAGSTAQTVHIYNNTFTNCGKTGNSTVPRGGAISFNRWGNGVTIEYNIFDGSHPCAVLILSAITATSTLGININNNNFINTEGSGAYVSTIPTAAVGYAIYNAVNTKVTATISQNYFSGNLTGNCYLCTSINESTSPNGALPGTDGGGGGSGGGGTVPPPYIPAGPYIPRSQIFRTSLSQYFREDYHVDEFYGNSFDGYLNQCPCRIAQYTPTTQKSIAVNKAPGMDARNLGNFGYSGTDLSLIFTVYSMEEAWDLLAAADSRIPAVLEPYSDGSGNYLDGWYITGIPATDTATVNPRQGDATDEAIDIKMSFLCDTPFYKRTVERIRTRRIYENLQKWSSADAPTGNQLKNYSFNSWSAGEADVAPDWWTLESTGQLMSEYTIDDTGFSLQINGDGATADIGSISQPVSCDASETYLVIANVAASGVTQGQLQIDFIAGGAIVNQIILDADSGFTEKQMYISNVQATTDAIIRVHVTGTANTGSSFYCNEILFSKASDVEVQETGTDIITLGKHATVPDFEVCSINSSTVAVTQDVAGSQVTLINGTVTATDDVHTYSSPATAYTDSTSLQLTVTLPALSNGGKYRIDNVGALLAIGNASYYGWLEVLMSTTSLGDDVKIAEWSANTLYSSSYTTCSTDISNILTANESVTFKFKLKMSNASATRAYAQRLTIKYTPVTPSAGYGDISGKQTTITYIGPDGSVDDVYSSAQTVYNATGKEAEFTIPAISNAKIRLDGLSFYQSVADSASYTSSVKVTVQSSTTYPAETDVIERTTNSVEPAYVLKSAVISNIKSAVNEALTFRFYLKTTNASHRGYVKRMTYKYTPLYPQTPPDPVAGANSISIWNDADPTTVLQLARNLLPCCKVVQNHDRTGSFECNLHFNDVTYLAVCSGHIGDTYSATNRNVTLEATTGSLSFVFDTQCPVTGIPWMLFSVVSGNLSIQISTDGSTWYTIDGDDTTNYTVLTPVYRELHNLANCKLKGETKIYIKVTAGTAGCVINYIKTYTDTVNLDGVYPKIYPNGANVLGALLVGNPLDVTVRSRDANRAI